MKSKEKLKEVYSQFKTFPFPETAVNNDVLQDIHSDFVLFDSYVAGVVDKILKNGKVSESELSYDITLESRMRKALISQNEQNKAITQSYLDYMSRLKLLIETAKLYI